MRNVKIVGLCLAAVIAVFAIMAGTASAEPVLHTCVKATEKLPNKTYKDGEFSDKACGHAEAGGKYKLGPFSAAKKVTFTIKGGAGANFGWLPLNGSFEPSYPGTKLSATTCTSEKGTGTFEEGGATFKVEYKGCKDGTKSCKTEDAKPKSGVIVDEQLKGKLVDLPGGRVGIDLTSATEPETGTLAAYNCEGLDIKAIGAVIGEVQGGQTEATKELKFNFQAGGDGVQQQWNYPTPTVSEEEGGYLAWQWSLESIFGGNPTPAAPAPQELKSVISGESSGVVPSQQGSKSEAKGELFKIVG